MSEAWTKSSHCDEGSCVETQWTKSSYSTDNGTCVEWAKSSYSSSNQGCVQWSTSGNCDSSTCVSVGHDPDAPLAIHVRDSKNPGGPILTFNRQEWEAFTAGVRAGEFDL